MRKPGLAAVGLGLIGIGSSLVASPATAAINCGTPTNGGIMTHTGDYCELVFATPGDYTFTVPSSANQLFALVAGGGSGAYNFNDQFGYSGNGGQVVYSDLTDSINSELAVHVGSGGATNPTGSEINAGGDSSVSSGNQTTGAFGGGSPYIDHQCMIPDFSWSLFLGNGALTAASVNDETVDCTGKAGLGVNPHNGDVDSDGNATPSIFASLDESFGDGGIIQPSTLMPAGLGVGSGAHLVVTTTGPDINTISSNTYQHGGNGTVILRWRNVAALASTGSNTGELSALAASLIALGTGLTVAAKVRRRTAQ